MWKILKEHILNGMNLFTPKVRQRVRLFPVWFTSHLRHLIKCLRTLQCKYSKHPIPNNFKKFVRAQCSFQDASKVVKCEYECSLVHNWQNICKNYYQSILCLRCWKDYSMTRYSVQYLNIHLHVSLTFKETHHPFNGWFYFFMNWWLQIMRLMLFTVCWLLWGLRLCAT